MQLAFLNIVDSVQFASPETMLERESYQEAAYDLFVREHGMSTDLGGFPELYLPFTGVHNYTLAGTSLRTILASQLTPFHTLSFAQRFSTAVSAVGWPVDAFLDLILRPEPARTVVQVNKDGKTALHWAAANFGEWLCAYPCPPGVMPERYEPHKRADSYRRLASELIEMGSDIHALWYAPVSEYGEIYARDSDPFIIFLRGLRHKDLASSDAWPSWERESLSNAVNLWGQMLVAGGHSLATYVATENRFLSRSHWIDACSSKWTFSPTRLTILEDGTLSLQVVDVFTLPVWKAQPIRVPGAWPVLSTPSSTIIWNPDAEDELDGFQWVKIASVTIVSDSYQVRPLEISAQSSDKADWDHTARRELISLTSQDDHGISANIITRESRICHEYGQNHSRQRAASLPPFPAISLPRLPAVTKLNRYNNELGPTSYHAAGVTRQVHKCVFDLRWRSLSEYYTSLRKCMHGHRGYPTHSTSEQSSPNGWEISLLQDEGRIRQARRFAERFHPGHMEVVEQTSRIAAERTLLMMGPRRPQDDGV
jgi:hypothetical protein